MKRSEGLGDEVFTMLSDPTGAAAKNYAGLEDPKMHVPATYVIGLDGKIVYEFIGENYAVRASAQDVWKAVQSASNN